LDEFFYENVIESSSDESNNDSRIMVVFALLVHNHEENQRPCSKDHYKECGVETQPRGWAGMPMEGLFSSYLSSLK
jgi:hypothetical protein